MNLKLTPKAQKMIAEKGDSVIVGLSEHICYGWGGAQSRDIPSVRWGIPQPDEIEKYEKLYIDGAVVYIRHEIKCMATARIDAVTGKVGNKLIFLGFVGGGWQNASQEKQAGWRRSCGKSIFDWEDQDEL